MPSGDGYSYHSPSAHQDVNLRRTQLPTATENSGYTFPQQPHSAGYVRAEHTMHQSQQWGYGDGIDIGGHAARCNAATTTPLAPMIMATELGEIDASAASHGATNGELTQNYTGELGQRNSVHGTVADGQAAVVALAVSSYLSSVAEGQNRLDQY
jgi:hypothetical protein